MASCRLQRQKLPVKGAFVSIISVEMPMYRYMVELLRLYSNPALFASITAS